MLAYCVPIFTKSVTIIYLSAELDNNSICVIGPRCPLSPNDCLHFRSQRNCFQRPPVNIGDLSLRISPAANEMREPCLGDQSEARIVTQSQWYLASELRNWGARDIRYYSQWRGTNGLRWSRDLCVTSSWHVTSAWQHGDWGHHGGVLCSCWVASDIQSSIRGKTIKTKLKLYKDTCWALFVWFYEATNNWNARHKLVQIEKSRNSGPYFEADKTWAGEILRSIQHENGAATSN